MLTCTPGPVNETGWTGEALSGSESRQEGRRGTPGVSERRRISVAEVRIQDGIIKVIELDVQDPKAAAVLAEYPEAKWAEVTRRALKIGLGYLKGGAQD